MVFRRVSNQIRNQMVHKSQDNMTSHTKVDNNASDNSPDIKKKASMFLGKLESNENKSIDLKEQEEKNLALEIYEREK